MNRVNTLEGIVQRIEPTNKEPKAAPNQTLVYGDAKHRKAWTSKPFLRRNVARFLVTRDATIWYEAPPLVLVANEPVGARIAVAVTCQLVCRAGSECKLVSSLSGHDTPERAFEYIVSDGVTQFLRKLREDGEDAALTFFERRPRWQQHLAGTISSLTGLECQVGLEPTSSAGAIEVKEDRLLVRCKDADDDFRLTYEAILDVEHEGRAAIFAECHEQLKNELRKSVQSWTARDVTTDEFCRAEQSLRENFRKRMDAVATRYGRQTSHLKLAREIPFVLPTLEDLEFKHACWIQGWPEAIEVQHKLLVSVQDVGGWRRAGVADLKAWLCSNIESITRQTLFDANYVGVVTSFDTVLARAIRDEVQKRAKAIGYELRQYSSVLNVEAKRLQRDGFYLEMVDEAFVTSDSRVSVRLSIIIEGRLKDLKQLEPILRPDLDLQLEMKQEALRAAADKLHKMNPKHFYLRFAAPAEDAANGRHTSSTGSGFDDAAERGGVRAEDGHERADQSPSVSAQEGLESAIASSLEARFGAVCVVTVKQMDTELTDRFRGLRSARPELTIRARPCDGVGINFRVKYVIKGVHPERWDVFQNAQFDDVQAELAAITDVIQSSVEARLGRTHSTDQLKYTAETHRVELEQFVFGWANQATTTDWSPGVKQLVSDTFGLVIEVISFQREDDIGEVAQSEETRLEVENRRAAQQNKRAHLIEMQATLQQKETNLLAGEGWNAADGELEAIRKAQEAVEEKLTKISDLGGGLRPHAVLRPLPPPSGAARRALLANEGPRPAREVPIVREQEADEALSGE